MASPFAAKDAGVEGELIDREEGGAEQVVQGEVLSDLAFRCLTQTGKGDMGGVFPFFQLNALLAEMGADFALQLHQRFTCFNASPDNTGGTTRREETNTFESEIKGRLDKLSQALTDIKEGCAIDLADEAEGEMELLDGRPACFGKPITEGGELFADSLGRIDGKKEALVHGGGKSRRLAS